MPLTEKQFKEYILQYGTTVEEWPDEILIEAIAAQHEPAMKAFMIEQQFFDEVLYTNRRFEKACPDFAQRIIHAAHAVKQSGDASFVAWIGNLLQTLLPQPAFAVAAMLMLGIGIGMASSTNDKDSFAQNYFDEDGAAL